MSENRFQIRRLTLLSGAAGIAKATETAERGGEAKSSWHSSLPLCALRSLRVLSRMAPAVAVTRGVREMVVGVVAVVALVVTRCHTGRHRGRTTG